MTQQGIKLPNGFAVTAEAYWHLINSGNILPEMKKILAGIDKNNLEDFAKRGHAVRELIYTTPLPEDLAEEIVAAYRNLPAVVGAQDATEKIQTGQELTVSCAEGDDGLIYERGGFPFMLINWC